MRSTASRSTLRVSTFCYDSATTAVTGAAMAGIYEQNLERRAANYAPLTPISFIARTAYTWPFRTAVVHGARRYTWADTYARSRRLASALAHRGEHARDVRMPLRRSDDGRRAEHAQHAARRRRDRVHAEAR